MIRTCEVSGVSLRVYGGHPFPFGASRTEAGINFSVVSAGARSMSIVFFTTGVQEPWFELALDPLQNRTGDVWHALVHGLPENIRYGYRADGPRDPANGLLFDGSVVLADPWAMALTGGAIWGRPLVREGVPRTMVRTSGAVFFRKRNLTGRVTDRSIDRSPKRSSTNSMFVATLFIIVLLLSHREPIAA